MNFTRIETDILDRIQKDIPFVHAPYASLADELNYKEEEVIFNIKNLRDQGVIRNISGIFNAESLGYIISLVAFEVEDRDVNHAAEIINAHPGVSHNYLRNHRYNIWFTLAADDREIFDKTVVRLAELARARDHLVLKNERLLKIGVDFSIGKRADSAAGSTVSPVARRAVYRNYNETERAAIRALQLDLPSVPRPFAAIAVHGSEGISEDDIIACGMRFKEEGVLRRYSAVLRHQKAGYAINAMTAWKPAAVDTIEDEIPVFMGERHISHLYMRTVYPGRWEHPLFAMIHARSEDELASIIMRLSQKSGITDYLVLHSIEEFKKKRVTYFSEQFSEWNRIHFNKTELAP